MIKQSTPCPPCLLALLLLPLMSASAGAETTLYRCVGADGKTTYSDTSCNGNGAGKSVRESTLEIKDAPTAPERSATEKNANTPGRWVNVPFYNNGQPPVIPFYYDPTNAPPDLSTTVVEGAIWRAATKWAAGCKVQILYKGVVRGNSIAAGKGLMIRWSNDLQGKAHPAHSQSGIGGTGGMRDGIRLNPMQDKKYRDKPYPMDFLHHVLLHEMGHVLGMKHNHDDKYSVMSYLSDYRESGENPVTSPNSADYRDCNFAMQTWFGVNFRPSGTDLQEHHKKRMSDKDVLEIRHGREQ